MAKSAFENLNKRLEGDDDGGDLNIDITVIADTEAEAAEEIVETLAEGDTEAEASEIMEDEEAAQDEVADMEDTAAALRTHGLTPGMAVVLNITMPLAAYGITMPGQESLDAYGKNQAAADKIATKLEAACESFWDSTKKFFQGIWKRIVQVYNWIRTRAGSMTARVVKANNALKDLQYDGSSDKEVKLKQPKHPDVLGTAQSVIATVKERCKIAGSMVERVAEASGTPENWKEWEKNDANEKIAEGLKFSWKYDEKDEDRKNVIIGIKDEKKDIFETDDKAITSAIFEEVKKGFSDIHKLAFQYEELGKNGPKEADLKLGKLEKFHDDAENKDAKKTIGQCRKVFTVLLKVTARANKVCSFFIMNWVGQANRCILVGKKDK